MQMSSHAGSKDEEREEADNPLTKQLSMEQETRPGRVMVASRGSRQAGDRSGASLPSASFDTKGGLRQAGVEKQRNLPGRAPASLSVSAGDGSRCAGCFSGCRQWRGGEVGRRSGWREAGRQAPPPSSGSKTRLCHARDFPKASSENGVSSLACQEESQLYLPTCRYGWVTGDHTGRHQGSCLSNTLSDRQHVGECTGSVVATAWLCMF